MARPIQTVLVAEEEHQCVAHVGDHLIGGIVGEIHSLDLGADRAGQRREVHECGR